ncbi:MAG: trypsin-like peptidase domain-containing protein [Roseovarius sp.]|nr:trypsin-like peptidase domain-containing protein [Roseovarius sp.]
MRFLISLAVCFLLTIDRAPPASAQDYTSLFRSFDASLLTHDDKRFLQAALAFEGHYQGLLDGAWGPISQSALERYSRAEFRAETEDWHLAMLAFSLFERMLEDGWAIEYFDALGLSLLVPQDSLVNDPPSDHFVKLRHSTSSLAISVGIHTKSTAQALHDYTEKFNTGSENTYTVRKTNFAVTSAKARDGSLLYTRSNFIDNAWSTVMLSAQPRDANLLGAVASSIQVGQARNIMFTKNGLLEQAVTALAGLIDEGQQTTDAVSTPTPDHDRDDGAGSAGSGFWVSEEGFLLTNAHVVRGCRNILVNGEKATLFEKSDDFDLALLQTHGTPPSIVARFAISSARLNSDVTAIGYPYAGLLGGVNVTRGSVSSLRGVNNDATTMQITAPIQSGNSGGPLLGPDGSVVGVVVAKLDAVKVASTLGDLPQNVNFAIRGEIAKLFLSQNGIEPLLNLTNETVDPVDLAMVASRFTVFVECQ